MLVACSVTTRTGEIVEFEALWGRRKQIDVASGIHVFVPSVDDLILTKRFVLRPKDVEDIRALELIRENDAGN